MKPRQIFWLMAITLMNVACVAYVEFRLQLFDVAWGHVVSELQERVEKLEP